MQAIKSNNNELPAAKKGSKVAVKESSSSEEEDSSDSDDEQVGGPFVFSCSLININLKVLQILCLYIGGFCNPAYRYIVAIFIQYMCSLS